MSRLIGGILLVAGTSIGAGMLAIPVITSFAGFLPAVFLLIGCWLFLLTTSFFLLDVTLSFKGGVNLITMADKTLGTIGKAICWVAYLLLLYSLNSAYIAGISPLFLEALFSLTGWIAPEWFGPLPLLFLLAIFVYLGTRTIDQFNRLLMIGLILSYFLLTIFLPSHVHIELLEHRDANAIGLAVPVIITSFGFHIIIPTLATYLHHDRKQLRRVLFIGSLIPLAVYFLWTLLVLGIVPLPELAAAYHEGATGITPLSRIVKIQWVSDIAKAFSFFAIFTSFSGVSLSLSHFLTDGLHMKRFSLGRELACLLTFLPPLYLVLSYPRIFILALQFAGIFVVVLLCILPACMALSLPAYQTAKKRLLITAVLFVSVCVISLDVIQRL